MSSTVENRRAPPRLAGQIAAAYFILASLWIVASDHLLSLSTSGSNAWVGPSTFKGLLFVAVTASLLYLVLRIRTMPAETEESAVSSIPHIYSLAGALIVLVLIVPVLGFSIIRLHSPHLREVAVNDLQAIADLKVGQIESWLGERRADTEVLVNDHMLVEQVARLIKTRDVALRAKIIARLEPVRRLYKYTEVRLVDASGRTVLALGAHDHSVGALDRHLLQTALAEGTAKQGELYRDAGGHVVLDFIAPLRRPSGTRQIPVAAVVLRSTMQDFLFPLIQTWPTRSASAESLLVRRQGDRVVFLNELRHLAGPPLSFSVSIDDLDVPAVVAVRGERRQITDGRDYRGIPVLAAMSPVTGTSWYLVAKIDRDEVYAPLNDLILWVSLVAVVAVIAISFVLLLLWRQQQRAHHLALAAQTAEKHRLLKLFYDLPFIGMTITSPTSKHWLHVNDRLCEIFGYPREELVNLTWPELTHPDDLAADLANFSEVMEGKTDGYRMDKRFIRKDGEVIHATIDVKAVRRADGSINVFVATVQDITERKRVEAEVARLNAELEQRVAERTAQLENINRELQTFTYSVSHDLKAPLRAIDGYSRLLIEDHADALDDEGRRFLANIRRGSQNMSQLIEDLLAYSRLERRALQASRLDPRSLIDAVIGERGDDIVAAGAVVRNLVEHDSVTADPDGLTMVFRNLLDNALKFTRDTEEPVIEVGDRLEDGRLVLWVRDNGIGFDMKFYDRIFEIFQRLHRIEDYPGTGIGLAIVRKAAERMGGRVWAESAPGRGATFYVELLL